ncbi:DoxX family protein [Streptomyces sp. N2-109]|uniref:DoxX family protein n=1 Tax=Streptomyces gossypii TaxID=2883101 RepID=A0ABT2JYU1_9ACTN|nr:DoxX family protein [Streptomyces gossypii]MCT2592510.1 DoxX family protein [Streptomyces gossypii]
MLLRRLARPLLATIFISGGINALRYSKAHADMAAPMLEKTIGAHSEKLPDSVPTDPETLVKLDAVAKIVAGTALALGRFPRFSAAVLLASLVPTTASAHKFWELEDASERDAQRIHFLKNAGLAGGLLLAVADTEGKPSLGWHARHVAHSTGKQVGSLGNSVQGGLRNAQKSPSHCARRAKRARATAGSRLRSH